MKQFKKGDLIKFIRARDFNFIKDIGQGGFGKTVLLEDTIINEQFICKKYSPYYKNTPSQFFEYFKNEIKILHLAYHRNIVRVYNYHLYPENHTGYILMEYIEGENIDEYIKRNPDQLNNIFEQAISGFEYLESLKILHRDIRPENILISKNDDLKIIDFGFSKKTAFENETFSNSVSLNWRYDKPQEFQDNIYDYKSEIYFVGKLFEEILKEIGLVNFKYKAILKTMCESNYEKRIESFFSVNRELNKDKFSDIIISDQDKLIYRHFADSLMRSLSRIDPDSKYKTDIEKIISSLSSAHQNSLLEEYVFNKTSIISCFISGNYTYYKNATFEMVILEDFIHLLNSSAADKRKVIINNLWQRFDMIKEAPPDYDNIDDDLPF